MTHTPIDLDEDEFAPEYAAQKVSLWLPEEAVKAFRAKAKKLGIHYKTLLVDILVQNYPNESQLNKVETSLHSHVDLLGLNSVADFKKELP